MKVNPAPLHLAQTILTGLVVALSIAILGTSAHTLDIYNKQQKSNPWWMFMWPQHFDTQGTKALLASSVVTVVLSGIFLVLSFIPQLALRQKYTLRALISLGTIFPCFLLTIITVVWARILNGNSPDRDTIQTWTCRYKNSRSTPQDTSVPSRLSNGNFGSLCQESKFALYGTLVVFLLLGFSMVVTVVTWLADKWAARQQSKEGAEMGSIQS